MKTTNKTQISASTLKTIIAAALLIISTANIFSQEIYTYDEAGNRTKRNLYICVGCQVSKHKDDSKNPTPEQTVQAMQMAMEHGISVYPNPANDIINVTVSGVNANETAIVHVLDESGKTITSFQGSASPSQIDMKPYKAGTYFVKVNVGNDKLFYRVIKVE